MLISRLNCVCVLTVTASWSTPGCGVLRSACACACGVLGKGALGDIDVRFLPVRCMLPRSPTMLATAGAQQKGNEEDQGVLQIFHRPRVLCMLVCGGWGIGCGMGWGM